MITESQYLAEFANLRQQPFWKGWNNDKLRLIAAMSLVAAGGGGGGGGGTINPYDLPLPVRDVVEILPGQSYVLNPLAVVLNGLAITYASPKCFQVHLTDNSGKIISLFNFRPILSGGVWGHILLDDRSARLPLYLPANVRISNPNSLAISTYLTTQTYP